MNLPIPPRAVCGGARAFAHGSRFGFYFSSGRSVRRTPLLTSNEKLPDPRPSVTSMIEGVQDIDQGDLRQDPVGDRSLMHVRVSHLCPKSREAAQNLPKSTVCVILALL